jgi:hypothetical protein
MPPSVKKTAPSASSAARMADIVEFLKSPPPSIAMMVGGGDAR